MIKWNEKLQKYEVLNKKVILKNRVSRKDQAECVDELRKKF
jgi:hypothetical protein